MQVPKAMIMLLGTTSGIAVLAAAMVLTGTGRVPTASAGGSDPLSSSALADLPVQLTRTAQIKPTGQVKSFNLVAERAAWELLPGVTTQAITYNGSVPGPTIRVTEGDTLRVTFVNELDQDTTVHWHGLHVPNSMDGVPGVTQDPVKPGATFTYEFTASHAGTFMYHPHANEVEQIDNGLYGLLIIDPQTPDPTRFDKDFSMVLGAWNLPSTTSGQTADHGAMPGVDAAAGMAGMGSPDMSTMQDLVAAGPSDPRVQQMSQSMGITPEQAVAMMQRMLATQQAGPGAGTSMPMGRASGATRTSGGMDMDYNYFTINGKAYPAKEPWTVQPGDLVRVRIVNISNLVHPMHLHGQDFKIIAKDGEPRQVQEVENTLSVNPGETYDIVFRADSPGTWLLHCHELHHVENNGVEPGGLIQAIVVQGATPEGAAAASTPTGASTQPAAAPTTLPRQGMPLNIPGMGHMA